jgi:hypothetical protein
MISSVSSESAGAGTCQNCGGVMAWRQAHPYPVRLQVLFGACFLAFLLFGDKIARYGHYWNYVWTGVGALLGVLLIRGRARAKKTVLRCIRCNTDLR